MLVRGTELLVYMKARFHLEATLKVGGAAV
jgi:hypothetical protein